jgi:hypothetical protein
MVENMPDPIPYDDGDRLSEAEFAKKIGKSSRTLRSWRERRVGPPCARCGRVFWYSWTRYLRFLAATEQKPRRTE